ncbi:hypothetical protein [Brenneria alni]|nr:hypothetical protein [Brenneria alni]
MTFSSLKAFVAQLPQGAYCLQLPQDSRTHASSVLFHAGMQKMCV